VCEHLENDLVFAILLTLELQFIRQQIDHKLVPIPAPVIQLLYTAL
jgi:hypothetical protein